MPWGCTAVPAIRLIWSTEARIISPWRWAIALTSFLSGLLGFLWYYTLGSVISVLLETHSTAQATAKSVKDIELTWVAPRSTPMPAPALSAPVTATDAPQVPTDAAS